MSIKLLKNPRGRGKDQRDSLEEEQYVVVPWVQREIKKGTSEESRERTNCNTKDGSEREEIFVKEGT